jgi:hypothetical protein
MQVGATKRKKLTGITEVTRSLEEELWKAVEKRTVLAGRVI